MRRGRRRKTVGAPSGAIQPGWSAFRTGSWHSRFAVQAASTRRQIRRRGRPPPLGMLLRAAVREHSWSYGDDVASGGAQFILMRLALHGGSRGSNPLGDTNYYNALDRRYPCRSPNVRQKYGKALPGRGRTLRLASLCYHHGRMAVQVRLRLSDATKQVTGTEGAWVDTRAIGREQVGVLF